MSDGVEERFEAYVDGLARVLGHANRRAGLRDDCSGLLLPLERKSVEPLAAATAPSRVSAQHQSLMHVVSQSAWSDERLLAKVRDLVLPVVEGRRPIEAWIIDDKGLRKQGRRSAGLARQHLGEIGKQDRRRVAASLSLANASTPRAPPRKGAARGRRASARQRPSLNVDPPWPATKMGRGRRGPNPSIFA